MSTHHVPPVHVAHLKAKLAILYSMSTDIHSDAELGRRFAGVEEPKGISAKAVGHWIFGDETREAGDVPAARFERLVAIFQQRLPGARSMAETRALVLSASLQDLVVAFLAQGPRADWISLMLAARPAAVRLLPARKPGTLSITTRRALVDSLDARLEFGVGQPFRLQIEAASDGWLTLVQWGRGGCHGVELDDDVISLHPIAGETLLPLRQPYFKESEAGPKRFLFMHSRVPLPPDLLSRLVTSARAPADLDGGTLERLAHLVSQPEGIELTALDVHFTDGTNC